jgi:hypothetical protein
MKKHLYITVISLCLLSMLTACSGTPQVVSVPTTDLNVIKTAVADAVQAQFTEAALSKPTDNPTSAATQTPWVVTATFEPSPTGAAGIATFTPVVAKPTVVYTYVYPTKTPGPARLVSQTPYDNTVFSPGESFDAVFTIQNNSTTNWNKSYYIRYVSGELVPSQDKVMIGDLVDIGNSTTFTVDYTAPSTYGTYRSDWQLVNDNGAAILTFWLIIKVE